MKTQTVPYDDGSVQAEIVVCKASYDQAYDWSEQMQHAQADLKAAITPEEIRRAAIQLALLPSLECGTVSIALTVDGQPVSLVRPLLVEAVTTLPSDLIDEWLRGVLALNPKWTVTVPSPAEVEKKVSPSTPASDAGTANETPSGA